MISAPRMTAPAKATAALNPEKSSVRKPWVAVGARSSIADRTFSIVASSTAIDSTSSAIAASTELPISST